MAAAGCDSDGEVWGLQAGEELVVPIRVISTLISVSITSAWFSRRKLARLSLFFAHWLSGVVAGLGFVVEDMMVTVCWITSDTRGFVKTLKFIEVAAANMFALTNLAICVNLALIVMSHRTVTRVRSVSSPRLILTLVVISMIVAALTIPLWEKIIVLGSSFWLTNDDERAADWIAVSLFFVGFFVGICMFLIVSWLLLFRMTELKECWKLHARIRYYFGLTIIGTAVDLGLGICGTVFVLQNPDPRLLAWSWMFRWIHTALDTVVLYGVLREKSMDERGGGEASDPLPSGQQPASVRRALGGSGAPNNTSKPGTGAPAF